jgi:hypothetical protein
VAEFGAIVSDIRLFTGKDLTMSKLVTIAALAGMIAITTPTMAETVYKWVDDNGVTHYQAHPPKNTKTNTLITKTGHSAPSASKTEKSSETQLVSNERNSKKAADKASSAECEKARANLNVINQGQRVRTKDANGNLVYLDDAQKAARKAEAQRFLDQAC